MTNRPKQYLRLLWKHPVYTSSKQWVEFTVNSTPRLLSSYLLPFRHLLCLLTSLLDCESIIYHRLPWLLKHNLLILNFLSFMLDKKEMSVQWLCALTNMFRWRPAPKSSYKTLVLYRHVQAKQSRFQVIQVWIAIFLLHNAHLFCISIIIVHLVLHTAWEIFN